MRILIVDDERDIRLLYKAFLRCEFPENNIDVVVDGTEAVNAFKDGNYDVLLMDLSMPGKDGYQACLEIQEISRKDNLKMPFVIFCTGLAISKEIAELTADKTHYLLLQKPVTYKKIIDTFRSLIDILALPCPSCGKRITQKDTVCPNCGKPCMAFSRNQIKPKKELDIPPPASADPNSFEIARIWASNGKQVVTLRPEIWDDPANWGIMLADLVKYVSTAYEQLGKDKKEGIARKN